ncbi:MAG TPA: hypothetical protein VH600_21940 [Burkholderiales bacterium]|jgi:hypothetical protein
MAIDFICMANEGYARWIELCVRAIERRQPGSAIHLYDLSEAVDSALRRQFEGHGAVRYTHFPPTAWKSPAWVETLDFDFVWPLWDLRESIKFYGRKLRILLGGARHENWMLDKAAHTLKTRRMLRLYAQKPYVIARTLRASPNNLVFIDADAIVLKRLDEVFDLDFDMALTAEAPQDVVVGPWPPECTERPSYPHIAINVGVMFVRHSPRMHPLLDAWIREMETVQHLSIEQTALAHLIYRLAPDFYQGHYRAHTLGLDGGEATVMALPMPRYNFLKMRMTDRGFAPEVHVAHFAGGKKQEAHWAWVRKMIADEFQDGARHPLS